jgi:hypothetical protein
MINHLGRLLKRVNKSLPLLMAIGTILLALLAAAQTGAPPADNVRAIAIASVTIIAAEEISFTTAKPTKPNARNAKAMRRSENGKVLIEFY